MSQILALFFFKPRQYNSICEAAVRSHLFLNDRLPKQLSETLFKLLQNYNANISALTTFMFNVAAFNEDLILHYDNQLLESTQQAAHFTPNNQKNQGKQSIQGIKVRDRLKKWLRQVFKLHIIEKHIKEATQASLMKNKQLRYFFDNIIFLIEKYQIQENRLSKIKELLKHMKTTQQNFRTQWTKYEGQQFIKFISMVSNDYTINLHELGRVVASNWTVDKSGISFSEKLLTFILEKTQKSELFSQKMQLSRLWKLFMEIFLQRQAGILIQFQQIFGKALMSNDKIYKLENNSSFQKLATLLTTYIPTQYPYFHKIVKLIFTKLSQKYGKNDAFELIKKFILNRFFLNIAYIDIYSNQQIHLQSFVERANQLRILFYEKKVEQHNDKQRIIGLNKLLINSLKSLINDPLCNSQGINLRDRGVYIHRHIIAPYIHSINQKLNKDQTASPNNSISFSLKNESASKIQSISRINIQSRQKQLPNQSKESDIIKEISMPLLPKPSKHNVHQSNLNAEQSSSLDYLVELRRQYGQMNRYVSEKAISRAERRQTWSRTLYLQNRRCSQAMMEISKDIQYLLASGFYFD